MECENPARHISVGFKVCMLEGTLLAGTLIFKSYKVAIRKASVSLYSDLYSSPESVDLSTSGPCARSEKKTVYESRNLVCMHYHKPYNQKARKSA